LEGLPFLIYGVMKSKLVKTVAGFFIFLFILAASVWFMRPVYEAVDKLMHDVENVYVQKLAENTGLTVSYKSLSPSFLTGIRVNSIVISDAETQEPLLTVRKAVFRYNIFRLLRKDFGNAFTKLIITDVTFDADKEKCLAVMQKIRAFTERRRALKDAQAVAGEGVAPVAGDSAGDGQSLTLAGKTIPLFLLPFEVQVRNIRVRYSDAKWRAEAVVRKLQLKEENRDAVSFTASSGSLEAVQLSSGRMFGVKLAFGGKLLSAIEGSSLILSLDQLPKAAYSLQRTQFLVRYDGGRLEARSTQRALPYSLSAMYSPSSGDFSADVRTQSLQLLSAVKVPLDSAMLRKASRLTLTLAGSIAGNSRAKDFRWQGNGDVSVPEDVIDGGEELHFSAQGTQALLSVTSLTAQGKLLDASLSGTYVVPEHRPEASLHVSRLLLPNGNRLAFDARIVSENGVIRAFLPELNLGGERFSGVNAAIDPFRKPMPFSLSFSGTSHSSYGKPAVVRASGEFMPGKSRRLSAKLSVDSLFLDTAARAAAFFLKPQLQEKIRVRLPQLEQYVTDDELSFSTDFKHFSFQVPAARVCNPAEERQSLELAFSGSDTFLVVNSCRLLYRQLEVQAEFDAEISPEDRQAAFNADCSVNGIPYRLSGAYTPGRWLTVTGSYGLDVLVNLEKGFKGNAKFTSLPVAFSRYELALSLETAFDFQSLADFRFDVSSLQCSLVKGRLGIEPHLSIMGNVTNSGFIMDTILYSDRNSTLAGDGYVLWNINGGILDSVTLLLKGGNELSGEKFSVEGSLANPLHAALTREHLEKDCYFTAQVDIRSFPMSRLFRHQYADDTFTGTLTASGTAENPYISLSVQNMSAQSGARPVIASGKAELLEGAATVSELNVDWGNIHVSNVTAAVDLKSFTGDASADARVDFIARKIIDIPLLVKVLPAGTRQEGRKMFSIPDAFDVDLYSSVTADGLINGGIPVHAALQRRGDKLYFSSEGLGASGVYGIKDGSITAAVDSSKPLHGKVAGKTKNQRVDLTISDLYCDFSKFSSMVSNDAFSVHRGLLSGKIAVSGMTSDPVLDGSVLVRDLDFMLPGLIPEHITAKNLLLTMNQNEIEIPDTRFFVKDGRFSAGCKMVLDRWSVDVMTGSIATLNSSGICVNVLTSRLGIDGYVTADTNFRYAGTQLTVNGTVATHDSELSFMNDLINIGPRSVQENADSSEGSALERFLESTGLVLNLDCLIGRKVNIVINPFLHALATPETPVKVFMDTDRGVWSIIGDAVFKGGYITYLSRNFYIKEGRLELNESQMKFDPFLTARAVTRERDADGVSVTIVLTTEHQPVSSFTPNIYSIPARSENEILAMLGQIMSGDAKNAGSLIASGVDYGLQITLFRKFENALRDLCNFDIFSVRINMVQNALRLGLDSGFNSKNPIGNYFDNTSVYIGKYFGSSIYADALLQWTYDESVVDSSGSAISGLVFHPELGLELDAPFANIRFNYAPDLKSLRKGEVPDLVSAASVTLSWSITF